MADDNFLLKDTQQIRDLHEALGCALTRWQDVEEQLFWIFLRIGDFTDQRIASTIFYSPHDFSEKLKCTHNIARFALKKYGLVDEWTQLRKEMINASEIRNALAHFPLVISTEMGLDGKIASRTIHLRPNFNDVLEVFKDRKAAVENLTAQTIREHIQLFNRLASAIAGFAEKIPPPSKPPPKSSRQS